MGASLGSCYNMLSALRDLSAYRNRRFSPAFHAFVQACCQLESEDRPSARELLETPHPFLKQVRKTATLLALPTPLLAVEYAEQERTEEEEQNSESEIEWSL